MSGKMCAFLTVKPIFKKYFKAVLIQESLVHAVEIGDVYCDSEKGCEKFNFPIK